MAQTEERARLLHQYAAGEISWSTLRDCSFENYVDVLAGLGELGLRYPVAPMEGPSRGARERGHAFIREALKAAG